MKKAVIIGAGPAGLTAAYELLTRTDIMPIVLERSTYMGGISRTVNYKGNRIDIGGHPFFSKPDPGVGGGGKIPPPPPGAQGEFENNYQNTKKNHSTRATHPPSPAP